jgi:hypothetical protein
MVTTDSLAWNRLRSRAARLYTPFLHAPSQALLAFEKRPPGPTLRCFQRAKVSRTLKLRDLIGWGGVLSGHCRCGDESACPRVLEVEAAGQAVYVQDLRDRPNLRRSDFNAIDSSYPRFGWGCDMRFISKHSEDPNTCRACNTS